VSDDNTLLIVLGLFYLASKYSFNVVKPAQQAGAKVYEVLHPSEKNHEDDLPGKRMKKGEIVALAQNIGFPDPNLAAAIAIAESGGYPGAINNEPRGGQSVGLWQIYLKVHTQYDKATMRDPIANAKAAYKISAKGTNWKPWSTFKTGAYRKYL
jgi:hypothetical protein